MWASGGQKEKVMPEGEGTMTLNDVKSDVSSALGQDSVLTKLVLKYGVSHARARQLCWRTLAGAGKDQEPGAAWLSLEKARSAPGVKPVTAITSVESPGQDMSVDGSDMECNEGAEPSAQSVSGF